MALCEVLESVCFISKWLVEGLYAFVWEPLVNCLIYKQKENYILFIACINIQCDFKRIVKHFHNTGPIFCIVVNEQINKLNVLELKVQPATACDHRLIHTPRHRLEVGWGS